MTDDTCPVCKARRESILREHYERMIELHEWYYSRVERLGDEHRADIMLLAGWKWEMLDAAARLHRKHAGGGDGS